MTLAEKIYQAGCKCPEPCPYHPKFIPLTDGQLLDIYMGHDKRGAFVVSNEVRQLVVEFRALKIRELEVSKLLETQIGEHPNIVDGLQNYIDSVEAMKRGI